LLFVWNIATLAFAMFLAGIFFAPTMIVAMTLVEASVPSSKLTEGLTWLITGLGVGVACGAALSGWVIDLWGTRAGFFVALGAGSCVLAVSLYGYGYLAKHSRSPEAKSVSA
jgi:MFS family permease